MSKKYQNSNHNTPVDLTNKGKKLDGAKNNPELIKGKKSKKTSKNNKGGKNSKSLKGEKSSNNSVKCKYKIFAPQIPVNQWYVERHKLAYTVESPSECLFIPLVIDTEFTDKNRKEYVQKSRLGLTTQLCGIDRETPKSIFALDPRVNAGRILDGEKPLPMVKTDFHPVDYLRSLGMNVEIWEGRESELSSIPKCFIVLYGHFLTAELNMIASGTVKERIKQLQRSQGDEQIASGRRAYCQKVADGQTLDWVSLKHVIAIEDCHYELCLKLVDTGAIHGVASYKNFCSAVGWELKYKDNFSSEEKSRMLDMAVERYKDFDDYSLGDLDVYDALDAFHQKWQIVYEKLGLLEYYQIPKLTIGGTVKDLFEAALAEKLGIKPTDDKGNSVWRKELNLIIDRFIKPISASELRQYSTSTRSLLSKVEGGRCRNNRPTDIFKTRKVKGKFDAFLICDIDIAGCYGEGQRNQSYFLGLPEIFDYKACKNNEYITLRNWLKAYDVKIDNLIKVAKDKNYKGWDNPDNWGELISGAWYARIRTKENLKYPQDFFASWFTETSDRADLLAKAIRKMKCDTELTSTDWVDFDEECGSLKIFNHQILNSVLTHDGLQWIFAICSPRQRNELLDKVVILASAVYPRSQKLEVESAPKGLEKLRDVYKNWKGRNTTERIKVNGRTKIVQNFDECHAWFDINLGDLLINDLLIERKKAQKVYGKKSPLDVLFKLCVNTMYGDMVSKYFMTSNPVVGNNITARARCLAWFMEKGLHGWQSITDGCAFELNGVLYGRNKSINGETVNQHRNKSDLKIYNIKRGALGRVNEILGYWKDDKFQLNIDGEDIENSMSWIDEKAMIHLQELFPLVDVLHAETTSIKIDDNLNPQFKPRKGQFSFETKDVYHSGCFHGSANYLLANPKGVTIKARGYELKKRHNAFNAFSDIAEGDEITFMKSDRYGNESNPAKDLMVQLLENPENVKRQLPAVKSGILKISDYKNLSAKYDEIGIEPGDSLLRTFLMREFSLSQFTFNTYEQYMNWKGIITSLNDKERQSIEGYFLNNDGTLNFVKMCNWVDEKIAEEVDKPFDILYDKNRHDRRTEKRSKQTLKERKYRGKGQKVVSLSHPYLDVFNGLREKLQDKTLGEVNEG